MSEPTCGVLSCTDAAEVVIDHREHGRRAVCAQHAVGHPRLEVLAHV